MKGSQLRFSLLLGVFVAMGCTQLKTTGAWARYVGSEQLRKDVQTLGDHVRTLWK